MLNRVWFKDAADRVLSTALFALIGYVTSVDHFDLWTVNWHTAVNTMVVAAAASLLKAGFVGVSPFGTPGTATPVKIDSVEKS